MAENLDKATVDKLTAQLQMLTSQLAGSARADGLTSLRGGSRAERGSSRSSNASSNVDALTQKQSAAILKSKKIQLELQNRANEIQDKLNRQEISALEAQKRLDSLQEKFKDRQLIAEQEIAEAMENSASYAEKNSDNMKYMARASVPEMMRVAERLTAGIKKEAAAREVHAGLMSSALLNNLMQTQEGSIEYENGMRELRESINGLPSAWKKQKGLIDQVTGQIRDNLDPQDFSNVRKSIGTSLANFESNFAELSSAAGLSATDLLEKFSTAGGISFGGEGAGEASQVNKFVTALESTIVDLINNDLINGDDLRKLGLEIDRTTGALTKKSLIRLQTENVMQKEVLNIVKGLQKSRDDLDKVAKSTTGFSKSFNTALNSLNPKEWLRKLASPATAAAGLAKAVDGVKRAATEISSFNVAFIPDSFRHVQQASVALGMSFEETVKFLGENKQLMATLGTDNFYKLNDAVNKTLKEQGFTSKQAAEFTPQIFENAGNTGVDIKNQDEMNEYVQKTATNFKKLSGVANLSMKQFVELNRELFNSQEVQSIVSGLDAEASQVYTQSLVDQRAALIKSGLTAQQAQEAIQRKEANKNEKASSRMEKAAKVMAFLSSMGRGAEGLEYLKLDMKGRRRDKAENERFTELATMAVQLNESEKQRSFESELRTEPYDIDNMVLDPKTAQAVISAQKSNKAITADKDAEAQVKAAPDTRVTRAEDIINSFSSLMSNSLVGAATGSATALLGLMAQTIMTTKSLGGLSKAGGGGSLGDMFGGSKGDGPKGTPSGKGAKGWLGKLKLPGVGLLGAGLGALALNSDFNDINDKVNSKEISKDAGTIEKSGAVGSVLGGAGLGYAGGLAGAKFGGALGLLAGPAAPVAVPIGTVVGGLLGVLGGGLLGSQVGSTVAKTGANAVVGSTDKKAAPSVNTTSPTPTITPTVNAIIPATPTAHAPAPEVNAAMTIASPITKPMSIVNPVPTSDTARPLNKTSTTPVKEVSDIEESIKSKVNEPEFGIVDLVKLGQESNKILAEILASNEALDKDPERVSLINQQQPYSMRQYRTGYTT